MIAVPGQSVRTRFLRGEVASMQMLVSMTSQRKTLLLMAATTNTDLTDTKT
jgi:hypothetical protein